MDTIKEDVIIYQGIRHQESKNRAEMNKTDDYFSGYFEPYKFNKKGKPQYYSYRKKDVFAHCEKYDVKVYRPIITWTAQDVFRYIRDNNFSWNPLYDQGHTRVGCYPCIQCRQNEVKLIAKNNPQRLEYLSTIEDNIDSTFFGPGYIPDRFCSKSSKKGTAMPSIKDVQNYLNNRDSTLDLFASATCKNPFTHCE